MAGYKSTDYASKSAYILVTRNPLKAHLEFFAKELSKTITPDYIKIKLQQITDRAMQDVRTLDSATKAIDVLNKMGGYYAPTNVNVQSVSASINDIRNARAEYKRDK